MSVSRWVVPRRKGCQYLSSALLIVVCFPLGRTAEEVMSDVSSALLIIVCWVVLPSKGCQDLPSVSLISVCFSLGRTTILELETDVSTCLMFHGLAFAFRWVVPPRKGCQDLSEFFTDWRLLYHGSYRQRRDVKTCLSFSPTGVCFAMGRTVKEGMSSVSFCHWLAPGLSWVAPPRKLCQDFSSVLLTSD